MKKRILYLIIFSTVILLNGCNQGAETPTELESNEPSAIQTTSPTDDTLPLNGSGGTSKAYAEFEYELSFYGISAGFQDLVGVEAFEKWVSETYDPNDHHEFTILNFIQYFNISKETFISTDSKYDHASYTTEQVEALYANDKKLLAENFVNRYAILVDDEIYTPIWVATHTLDELKAAGITESILEAKCSEWKETFGESSDVYTGAKALLDQYQAETEPTE